MTTAAAAKQFADALNMLARTYSRWEVFNDFLDYTLLMMKWWDLKPENFSELEKKYSDEYSARLFAQAYESLSYMADDNGAGFKDPFGDFYMEFLSNDRTGQFFTPEDVCDMIAHMMIPADLQDGQSVCDPCCGSGRLLLSAAKINRKAIFYAADIDKTCCKMTLINFLLNSMTGEIAWMDTLGMKHWGSWHTKTILAGNGFYLPYYYETGAGNSRMANFNFNKQGKEEEGIASTPVAAKSSKKWKKVEQARLQLDLFGAGETA